MKQALGPTLGSRLRPGFVSAAREVRDQGTFGYLDRCLATPELNELMSG